MIEVNERNNLIFTAPLTKSDGEPLTLAEINSATLSLWDVETLEVINDRDKQDVLNDNNVTIVDGQLIWEIQSEDNPIITVGANPGVLEAHNFVFDIVFNTAKHLVEDDQILVKQISFIPAVP